MLYKICLYCRHFISISILALILQACGSGRIPVVDPVKTFSQSESFTIRSVLSSLRVPDEIDLEFDQLLRKKLYQETGVKEGPEIIISYRLINIDRGNQFKRWFLGGTMEKSGEGTFTAEVTYLDKNNNILAKINTEGKTEDGLFGGTFSNAIEKAAEQIVRYTLQTFKPEIVKK